MNQRILITGALGHIGSGLIHSITPDEFKEVRMVDNLSTQRYASLFNLPAGVNFTFIEDDILKADMKVLTRDVDVVVHLAAITDAASSFERRKEVEKVNYQGTKRLAQACIENNVRLLFPSTTSVYGSQSEVVDENCSIEELKPQSPYADYKLKSEQMLQEMGLRKGLKFVSCRFGTIFGTSIGMRFHTAVNKFCWQAVMGQPITVWRTALNQRRPYLDLKDALGAIWFIIKHDIFDCRKYNILTTNKTVKDIVDIISNHVTETTVSYVDTRIMNQLSYTVLNKRFTEMGFEFKGSLEQGIAETIKLVSGSSGKN